MKQALLPQSMNWAPVRRHPRGIEAQGYSITAGDVASLLPGMERLRSAGDAKVGRESFERRLRDEAAAADAALMSPLMVGAWTRVP